MEEQSNSYIISALAEIKSEEWKKLLLTVHKWFGKQLQKVSEAPSPEDLLHEAIEDVLNGRRSWPQEKVSLPVCLRTIVRSKVDHIVTKGARAERVHVTDEAIDWELDKEQMKQPEDDMIDNMATPEAPEENFASALGEYVFQGREYELELQQVLKYWVEHINEDVTIEQITAVLGLSSRDGLVKTLYHEARLVLRENLKDVKLQELRKNMLDCVKHDAELTQILIYRFSNAGAKIRDLAAALGVEKKVIYRANRRLKTNRCLEGLYKQL